MLLHHYINISVQSAQGELPTYDGDNYYIPPHCCVVLVPCNSVDPNHMEPSATDCILLNRTGFQTAEQNPLLVMFVIDNVTDVGLLLRHGDVLGLYYGGAHRAVRAEQCFMPIPDYCQLRADQTQYWDDIYYAVEEDGEWIAEPAPIDYPSPIHTPVFDDNDNDDDLLLEELII